MPSATSAQGSLPPQKARKAWLRQTQPKEQALPASHGPLSIGWSLKALHQGSCSQAAKKQRQWQIKTWQGFWDNLIPHSSI